MSRHDGFDEFRFAEPTPLEDQPEVTLEMELAMTVHDMEMAITRMGALLYRMNKQGKLKR